MDLSEIKAKKIRGDNIVAGAMLGKGSEVVRMTLNNPKSKDHKQVCDVFEKIIKSREQLINS